MVNSGNIMVNSSKIVVNSSKIVVNSGKFPGRKFFDEKNVPHFFFECRKIK